MKKLLVVLALAGVSMTTFAQDDALTEKYSVATNSFWSNWFIQLGADWNAWYSDQEHGRNEASSPLKRFRANPGASFAIGKWFTQVLVFVQRYRVSGENVSVTQTIMRLVSIMETSIGLLKSR